MRSLRFSTSRPPFHRGGLVVTRDGVVVEHGGLTPAQGLALFSDPAVIISRSEDGESFTPFPADERQEVIVDLAALSEPTLQPDAAPERPDDAQSGNGQSEDGQDQGTDLSQPVGGQVADSGAGGTSDPASATQANGTDGAADQHSDAISVTDGSATTAAPAAAVGDQGDQAAGQPAAAITANDGPAAPGSGNSAGDDQPNADEAKLAANDKIGRAHV